MSDESKYKNGNSQDKSFDILSVTVIYYIHVRFFYRTHITTFKEKGDSSPIYDGMFTYVTNL